MYDLVIGNVQRSMSVMEHCLCLSEQIQHNKNKRISPVEVRLNEMSKNNERSAELSVTLNVDNSIDIDLDQADDKSLVECRYEAKAGKKRYYKKGAISWCFKDCDILLRR